jgi:hypothetical protein
MPNELFFSYIIARTSQIQWYDDDVCFVLDQQLGFYSVIHWNNSLWLDMTLHLDTLLRFRVNKSLLLLHKTMCLAEKQQLPILLSLVWLDRSPNPWSTTFMASTLNHYTTDAVFQ